MSHAVFLCNKMTKLENDLIHEFHKLDSKESLIQLINNIYNQYAKISDPLKKGKKCFTEKQINFYLHYLRISIEQDNKLYDTFEILKKNGGKRVLHAPKTADFKDLLSCIDLLIRQIYEPHPNAFGFIEKRSIVDNARKHLSKNYVYNIDLKDFFHSFDLNRVKLSLFNKPFNLKGQLEPIAFLLASLVTCNLNGKRVLPQGSPVSPALTNHICWRLDQRLSGLAKRFGVDYSRYADDITFSSNHNVYYGDFSSELKRIIQLEDLEINPSKTRLQKKGSRQEVTGIIVNEGLNVSKRYIKQLRMYLYYCEKYGIEKATEIYTRDYKEVRKEGELFREPDKLENILKGKLNFLSMVKGKDDKVYVKLSNRFNLLFDTKSTLLDQIILHWMEFGIDSARKEYYKNKNNNRRHVISEFRLEDHNQIEQLDLRAAEKLFHKDNSNLDSIYVLEYFDLLYGFQFKNEKEQKSEYELLAEKWLMKAVNQNKNIKTFLNNLDKKNLKLALEFLKNKLKDDPLGLGLPFAEYSEKNVLDTASEFEVYKEKRKNG